MSTKHPASEAGPGPDGPDPRVTAGRSHRTRLARQWAHISGLTYQQALAQVIAAAEAGDLPPHP